MRVSGLAPDRRVRGARSRLLAAIVILGGITFLHLALNLNAFAPRPSGSGAPKFRVGFLPVTCHLTCPVTHFINEQMTGAACSSRCGSTAGRS